jgi:hypothetical protein
VCLGFANEEATHCGCGIGVGVEKEEELSSTAQARERPSRRLTDLVAVQVRKEEDSDTELVGERTGSLLERCN